MSLKDRLKELKATDLNCNVFDVYSYNGLSIQELLCQFFTKINECIGSSNNTLNLVEWLVSEGLEEEVAKKLVLMCSDGTIEKLINDKLFQNLNNKISEVNTQLNQKPNKNHVWSMSNMGQDIREAITGGSVAVVGRDSILKDNIVDGCVTEEKTSFIDVSRINLFDKSDVEVGFIADAGYIANNENYRTSGFIKINYSSVYKTKNTVSINHAFYDGSNNLISVGKTVQGIIQVPGNAEIKYLRFSFSRPDTDTIMLVKDDYPSEYIPFTDYTVNFNTSIHNRIMEIANESVEENEYLVIGTTNYFNPNTTTSGFVGNDGDLAPYDGVYTSDYIKVKEGETLITNLTWQGGFYNSIKKHIGKARPSAVDEPLTVPKGASYVRISGSSSTSNPYVYKNKKPSLYTPYTGGVSFKEDVELGIIKKQLDPLYKKKWLVIGDSISANINGYHKYISDRCGCEIVNHAISGSRISKVEGQDCMTERIDSMPNDIDIVTIFGGTNDYGSRVPLGNMNDRGLDTFYGACHTVILKIINKYHGKKIGVLTPMMRGGKSTSLELKKYVDVVEEVANYYSIPVLNLWKDGGIDPSIPVILENYIPDGLHPGPKGCEVISRPIENFIKRI